jgi:hypothetical protein
MIALPTELISLILSYLPYQSFPALLSTNTNVHNRCTSELCLRSLFQEYDVTALSYTQLKRSLSHISSNTTYFHPNYKYYPLRWAQDEYLIDIFDRLLMLHRNEFRVQAYEVNRIYRYVGGCITWHHNQELRFVRDTSNQLAHENVDEVKAIGNRIVFRSQNEWYLWEQAWSGIARIGKFPPLTISCEAIVNGTICVMRNKYGFDYILDERGYLSCRHIILAENVEQFWYDSMDAKIVYYLTFDGKLFMCDVDCYQLIAQDVSKVLVESRVYYLTKNKNLYQCDHHFDDRRLIMEQVDAIYLWGKCLYFAAHGKLYAWSSHNKLTTVICCSLPSSIKEISVSPICMGEGNEVIYCWCRR